MQLLITPHDAADLTGIGVHTIRSWCKDRTNNFPAFKVGRDFKIVRKEFEEWIGEMAKGRVEL